jgi:hypothetical protein
MNIKLINIEQLPASAHPSILRPAISDEFRYVAIAIEEDGKCYYWALGVSIEISNYEHDLICANSKIFYFSIALDLHHRIINAKLAKPAPIDANSEMVEKVRLYTNTFAEKWRVIESGAFYYRAYGHLRGEYQGLITEAVYEQLKKTAKDCEHV